MVDIEKQKTLTPIIDFLERYTKADISRMHMPGHKGRGFSREWRLLYEYDITEITGADSLYDTACSNGIIAQSEDIASRLYDSKHTSFSAGGSTLCIQAMLRLAANQGDTIIAGRNVHAAFVNACALLDLHPYFIHPEYNDSFFVSGVITPEAVEAAIKSCGAAKAVYITSPNYLGQMSDISGISKVCKKHGIMLLVDNAHGAHLKFMPKDRHPLTLGADICCDSAHKTLPVLTGGAYLHISKKSSISKQAVKAAMSLFGSTSPSYLILASLDMNNEYLVRYANSEFKVFSDRITEIEACVREKGFTIISDEYDTTKLTLNAYQVGMTGDQLKQHFEKNMIEVEYSAEQHIVLMMSPQNTERDLQRIIQAVNSIDVKPEILCEASYGYLDYNKKRKTSIRTAVLSNKTEVSIEDALGKTSAEVKIKCPPGVPIVLPGEIIDKQLQKLLKKTSVLTINVLE